MNQLRTEVLILKSYPVANAMNARVRPKTYVMGLLLLSLLLGASSCTVRPPSNPDDICSIFTEKRLWYRAAKRTSIQREVPIVIMMAFIYQESRFRMHARPVRNKILWIFPGARPSDAYGYAQAIKSTWEDYKKSEGKQLVSRSNFTDAIDFVGWYNQRSIKLLNIDRHDTYNLYLAYHEGWTGYNRETYKDKEWLGPVAEKVKQRAELYQRQLDGCQRRLNGSWIVRLLLFPFRLLLLPMRLVF